MGCLRLTKGACRESNWLLLAPIFWVASDVLFLDGFKLPLDTGIILARSVGPLQLASVLGSAGIAFLMLLTAALGAQAILYFLNHQPRNAVPRVVLAVSVALAATWSGKLLLLDEPRDTCLAKVAIAQPVIPVYKSRDSEINISYRQEIYATVERYLAEVANTDARFFIWPEGGGTFASFRVGDTRELFQDYARQHQKQLFISVIDYDQQGQKFNSLFSVDPRGGMTKYNKIDTVPFSEDAISPGLAPGIVDTEQGKVGVLICFEACFPSRARATASSNPFFLLVSTSDVVFGISSMPELHLSMSILRAVENRRSVVHASNGGPSAIIDPYGRLTAKTQFLENTTLHGCVASSTAPSFFTRIGYRFRYLCVLLTVVLVVFALVRRFRQPAIARYEGSASIITLLIPLIFCAGLSVVLCGFSAWVMGEQAATEVTGQQIINSLRSAPVSKLERRTDFSTPVQLGAATLVHLANYYGVAVDEGQLVNGYFKGSNSISSEQVVEIAQNIGFQARMTRKGWDELSAQSTPFLVSIGGQETQYAIVYSLSDDSMTLYEPWTGYGVMTKDTFLQYWDGRVIYIRPGSFSRADVLRKPINAK